MFKGQFDQILKFFNPITGKRFFRPYFSHLQGASNLHFPEVPKDSQRK